MAGRYLVENPAKVAAADLADLAEGEALAQNFNESLLEESSGLARPSGVGGLAGPGGKDVGVAADGVYVDA